VLFEVAKLEPATLDLFDLTAEEECLTESVGEARAIALSHAHAVRRANSEAMLAQLLPARIPSGMSYHVMSAGDVDSLSYVAHIVAQVPVEYLILSTWCMAKDDVAALSALRDAGRLGRVDAYVGEIFPNQYVDAWRALCALTRARDGRCAVFRNHSKVYVLVTDEGGIVIESSANVNTNPRAEQTAIHASDDLARFYKSYFDGIKSYNRDFDDWRPAVTQLDT
jgi:hypothetical protein